MNNNNYYCNALCQHIDLGLFKFIYNLNNSNIRVKTIIIAKSASMHPKRKKQLKNYSEYSSSLINKKKENYINKFKRNIKSINLANKLIKIAYNLLLKIFSINIIDLNKTYILPDTCCNDTLVMYSYEGLLDQNFLDTFKGGIINIHPAKLPNYRGLDGSLWALYENAPLGVTAYLIDIGIDTGKIIKFYPLKSEFKSLSLILKISLAVDE